MTNETKFKEIEFKYRADCINLVDFREFCEKRVKKYGDLEKQINVSGWDYFFKGEKDESQFCRFRVGEDMRQLTFKRKLSSKDSIVRTEHNITVSSDTSLDAIEALLKEFNYTRGGEIYKNCFIYIFKKYTLVYYVVYDKYLNELDSFMEIEASEHYPWKSKKDALKLLTAVEKDCKVLGVGASCRVKLNLFELYGN